jgi:hypothetical protein
MKSWFPEQVGPPGNRFNINIFYRGLVVRAIKRARAELAAFIGSSEDPGRFSPTFRRSRPVETSDHIDATMLAMRRLPSSVDTIRVPKKVVETLAQSLSAFQTFMPNLVEELQPVYNNRNLDSHGKITNL